MAEVNEQDGVSNCPIFNELDNKLANSEINEVVHIELPNLEHTEQLEVSSGFLSCVLLKVM